MKMLLKYGIAETSGVETDFSPYIRSITQTFQLLEDFQKFLQTKDQSAQASFSNQCTNEETQTSAKASEVPAPLQLGVEDIRDDEVLECLTEQNKAHNVLQQFDDIDTNTKNASSIVFNELKSILHKEVFICNLF